MKNLPTEPNERFLRRLQQVPAKILAMVMLTSTIGLGMLSPAESQSSQLGATIYWEGTDHYTVAEQVSTYRGVVYREVCDGGSRCEVPYRPGRYRVQNSASQHSALIVVDPPEVTTEHTNIAGQSSAKVTYFVLAQVDETATEIFW